MDRLFLIAASILIVIVILWWVRNYITAQTRSVADLLAPKPLNTLLDKIDSTPDSPISFGYKMSWLSIKASDAKAVRESLNIENLQTANWHTGCVAAYNGHTFISPSVNGWVFVVSHTLPELGHATDEQEWITLMSDLSRTFDDVQYFSTHRVSDYNAWARFNNGAEVRAFAYCIETLVDRGVKTSGEEELGYNYFDSETPEAGSDSYWEREDLCFPAEEHVMELAGKWSVNPQTLEQLSLPNGSGWICNLVRKSKGAA